MTTSWQAVTPLLTIQEAEETEMISLIASPAPPSLGSLSLRSPAAPDTSRARSPLSPLPPEHSQEYSPGSSRSTVLVSPQPLPSPAPLLFDPQPHIFSPPFPASSPQPTQPQPSPLLVPPTSRSGSLSPAQDMEDLLDIDFDDLLGSRNWRENNIVTDGHKAEIRRQSKEKSGQGDKKPKEEEIEEKMANLLM